MPHNSEKYIYFQKLKSSFELPYICVRILPLKKIRLYITRFLNLVWLFCDPMDYSLPGCSVLGFPSKNTGVGCHLFSRGFSWPRDWTPGLLHLLQILYHWATIEALVLQHVFILIYSKVIFWIKIHKWYLPSSNANLAFPLISLCSYISVSQLV